MSSNCGIQSLPEELMLKIFSYFNCKTIRQTLSLVSKEFNRLSRDQSLYFVYKTSFYDVSGIKVRAELNYGIFLSNLTELETDAKCLKNIRNLQFVKLKKLVIDLISTDEVGVDTCGSLLRDGLDLELRGKALLSNLDQQILQYLSRVECLIVTIDADFLSMLNIPTEKFVLRVDSNALNQVQERVEEADFQSALRSRSFELDLSCYSDSTQTLINPQFSPLMQKNLVDFATDVHSFDNQLPETLAYILKTASSLRYVYLLTDSDTDFPVIKQLASTHLEDVSLTMIGHLNVEASENFLKRCSLLLNNDLKNLYISQMSLDSWWHGHLLKSLTLNSCEFTYNFLLDLPDSLEFLDLNKCGVTSPQAGLSRRKGLNKLWIENCPGRATSYTLQAFNYHITGIEIRFVNASHIIQLIPYLRHLNVLDEIIIHVSCDISRIDIVLETLLISSQELKLFKYGAGSFSIGDSTMELLKSFTMLRHFQVTCANNNSRELIRRHFPDAIVDVTDITDDQSEISVFL